MFLEREQAVKINIIGSTLLAEILNQLAFLFAIYALSKIRISKNVCGAYEIK